MLVSGWHCRPLLAGRLQLNMGCAEVLRPIRAGVVVLKSDPFITTTQFNFFMSPLARRCVHNNIVEFDHLAHQQNVAVMYLSSSNKA